MHYLEQHSDEKESPLELLKQSKQKKFDLKGEKTKKGLFGDNLFINFTRSEAQNIIDFGKTLIRESDLKPFRKSGKIKKPFSEENIYSKKINHAGIGNLDVRLGEKRNPGFVQSTYGFRNLEMTREDSGNRETVDLKDETSDDLFRKSNRVILDSKESGVKKVKRETHFSKDAARFFKNIL